MSDLGYVVEKFDGKLDYTVHLWTPGEVPSDPLWKAPVGKNPQNEEEQVVSDHPIRVLATNGHLYMGMHSGHVEKLDIKTGESLARYGQRESLVNGKVRPTKIRRLVLFDGKVHDASYAGLFETDSGEEVDDRQIGSAEVYDGRLLIVPHGANPKQLEGRDYDSPRGGTYAPELFKLQDSLRESKAGDLIDALSKDVVMGRVEPFDGSGMAPGKHTIVDGKAYMHHGNHPFESITIRDFPSGDVINIIRLITTGAFIEHEGVVYDIRECPEHPERDQGNHSTRILRSNEDYHAPSGSLFDKPKDEHFSGVVSAGVDGLLIALYNGEQNRSRIVSHLNPNEPLLESEGRLFLSKL